MKKAWSILTANITDIERIALTSQIDFNIFKNFQCFTLRKNLCNYENKRS